MRHLAAPILLVLLSLSFLLLRLTSPASLPLVGHPQPRSSTSHARSTTTYFSVLIPPHRGLSHPGYLRPGPPSVPREPPHQAVQCRVLAPSLPMHDDSEGRRRLEGGRCRVRALLRDTVCGDGSWVGHEGAPSVERGAMNDDYRRQRKGPSYCAPRVMAVRRPRPRLRPHR
jgi:hypothetical protein